jgi:hypothetical protein
MKTISSLLLGVLIGFAGWHLTPTASAIGECSDYGIMAQYDYLTGKCKCSSGYYFADGILGPECKSMSSYCTNKYGFMSRYDSLSDSCECMAGYIMTKSGLGYTCTNADSECRSQLGLHSSYDSLSDACKCNYGYYIQNGTCTSTDNICSEKLGYNSRYNILTDSCECDSGYVLSQKEFGSGLECRSCTDKHGIHAEYNGLTKECECESGYTPDDDNQCVQKQNNVYFEVIELDDDNNEVIIRSDFDGSYYHIDYGLGCLSFWRYEDKKIVVNLGTDYTLDTWDTIVLQDHEQTCNIVTKERVDSSFSLNEEDDSGGYYIPVSGDTFERDIASSPYKQAIENLKQKGIVGGYPDGSYKPKNMINRAEFMKIVMGAVGTQTSGNNCYPDVKDEWFAAYACAAKQQEIATGYPDGTFRPTNDINVVEALKIVLKAFVIPVRGIDEGEDWFEPYIEVARSNELYVPSFNSPDKKITREEMAELVNRILDLQSRLAR